jgi:hypothetical protein
MKNVHKMLLAALAIVSTGTAISLMPAAKAQNIYDVTAQCNQVRQSTYNSVKSSIIASTNQYCGQPNSPMYASCSASIAAYADKAANEAAANAEEQCWATAFGG